MTNQFKIRPIKDSDADWIYRACQDPEIQKWTQIPKPYRREHAVTFAKTLSGDLFVWVIESDDFELPFGVVGIHSINQGTRIADIGYWLAPWGRKKGAMRSGLQKVIAELKSQENVAVIQATIAIDNIASRQVVTSIGFSEIVGSQESCNCGGNSLPASKFELCI